MINQLLCFPDGNSVVPFLRSLISACLITWPWYLPFPNICVRLNGDLRLNSGFCVAYVAPDPSHFFRTGVIESRDSIKWLFISFYCIFTHWPVSCEKKKLISLKGGAWNVCLRTPGYFATATFSLIGFLWVYNECRSVFVLGCVCFKDWRLIWRRHCAI